MSHQPSLRSSFGFWTGWFLVVACMVGSGILTNSGPILKTIGDYPTLLLLWAAGGVIALAGALTLGELASGLPKVGGDYAFVREAFGPVWGFVYGWAMVILGFAAPIALISHTTALYLQPPLIELLGSRAPTWLASKHFLSAVSSGLITLFTLLHCLGQTESSRVQGLTTLFKLAVLVALIPIALASPHSSWSHLGVSQAVGNHSFPVLASSLILVMYAYTGWNAAAYLAGEIRESSRVVPSCLTLGCLSVTALYLLVNLAYGLALPVETVAGLSNDEINRIADRASIALMGQAVGRTFSFLVSLGVVASLSAYTLTGPRVVFAMAHDRLLPMWAGHVDRRSGTPVRATLFQGVVALLLLWSGTFQDLLDFTGYGLAVLGILVVAPIFALRRREEFKPRFRVPFYPWPPVIFLALSAMMLVGGALDNPKLAFLSTSSIAVAFPLYWVWHRRDR